MENKRLKISVCITVFNENKETIDSLLKALNNQSLKPDEIIIIDGKDYGNCSRSKGRNIAIERARNRIIAITDAGCVPNKDWLLKITKPFNDKETQVVAGGYEMISKNSFQKACSVFLGVKRNNMRDDFMPSARSMAFTKEIWKKVGGFPEELNETAEDTLFNFNLIKIGVKFVLVKDAIVNWLMPNTISEFFYKIKNYANGDGVSGIWWHPVKKWKTHNIKILTIYLRYLLFLFVFLKFGYLYLCLLLLLYAAFAFYKARWWGIILQFVSDFGCIIGFSHGLLQTSIKRN